MRIDLPDGAWWEVKDAFTRGDRRRVDEQVRRHGFTILKEFKSSGINLEDLDGLASRSQPDAPKGLTDEEEDFTLVSVTVAWSFPEKIDLDGVYARDERDARRVADVIKELYGLGPTDEDQGEAGEGK